MRPRGILESALYCDDLERAEAFYAGVLGLERLGRQEGRHVFFRCGDGVLLLFIAQSTRSVTTTVAGVAIPLHGSDGPGHLAFRASIEELASWKRRLIEKGIPIEAEVAWPAGGRSIYFRDPSGNSLEFATPELWGIGSP